jgi:hypothetical protein
MPHGYAALRPPFGAAQGVERSKCAAPLSIGARRYFPEIPRNFERARGASDRVDDGPRGRRHAHCEASRRGGGDDGRPPQGGIFMSKLTTFLVGTLSVGTMIGIATVGASDALGRAPATSTIRQSGDHEHRDREKREREGGVSSPILTGVWKFMQDEHGKTKFDTEFRFINSSDLDLTLEYAFFDPDGNFCGCDRDDLPANKTTIYTILGEKQNPPQFTCDQLGATSGAVQAIVFRQKGSDIDFDDAEQVGFQTTAFRDVDETSDNAGNFNFLTGRTMTASPMQNIVVTEATLANARFVHQQCVDLIPPM